MRRFLAALLIVFASHGAIAQPKLLQAHAASGSLYVGPGDIVSGATAWYGLRAYNAAYAATPGTSVNVRRASDNVACDFNVSAAGGFGVTTATCNSSTQGGVSYAAFVGTDATASCTIAGTSAACTGASATLHVGDLVTGVGVSNPCIVAATNGSTTATISLAGPGTSCGTVSVAETLTFQVAGWITKLYDQSGANFCTSAPCDISQATAADQFQFLPLCANNATLPCWLQTSAGQVLTAGNVTAPNTTMTFAAVGNRAGGTGANEWLIFGAGGNHNNLRATSSSANSWQLIPGGSGGFSATANDNTWHSAIGVMNAGSSVLNIDGTETTGSATGSTASGPLSINRDAGIGVYETEAGVWGSTIFTLTQRTNVCGNMATYYATAIGANC